MDNLDLDAAFNAIPVAAADVDLDDVSLDAAFDALPGIARDVEHGLDQAPLDAIHRLMYLTTPLHYGVLWCGEF
jgi:hypothetical protein